MGKSRNNWARKKGERETRPIWKMAKGFVKHRIVCVRILKPRDLKRGYKLNPV
jgi:hypothetical protein